MAGRTLAITAKATGRFRIIEGQREGGAGRRRPTEVTETGGAAGVRVGDWAGCLYEVEELADGGTPPLPPPYLRSVPPLGIAAATELARSESGSGLNGSDGDGDGRTAAGKPVSVPPVGPATTSASARSDRRPSPSSPSSRRRRPPRNVAAPRRGNEPFLVASFPLYASVRPLRLAERLANEMRDVPALAGLVDCLPKCSGFAVPAAAGPARTPTPTRAEGIWERQRAESVSEPVAASTATGAGVDGGVFRPRGGGTGGDMGWGADGDGGRSVSGDGPRPDSPLFDAASADPVAFSYWAASNLPLPMSDRLDLLETDCVAGRLRTLLDRVSDLRNRGDELVRCRKCRTAVSSLARIFSVEGTEGTVGTYGEWLVSPGKEGRVRLYDSLFLLTYEPHTRVGLIIFFRVSGARLLTYLCPTWFLRQLQLIRPVRFSASSPCAVCSRGACSVSAPPRLERGEFFDCLVDGWEMLESLYGKIISGVGLMVIAEAQCC